MSVNNIRLFKHTKSRSLVYNYFLTHHEVTINELLFQFTFINKTTIYRTIDLFLNYNMIIEYIKGNQKYYSIKSDNHQHIIECKKCHNKTIIDYCPFDIIDTHGYKVLETNLKIFGICPECIKKN